MSRLLSLAVHGTARKALVVLTFLLFGVLAFAGNPFARTRPQAAPTDSAAALLEGFRHVEVASVSDAIEQLTGRKMYMSHRMRPIFATKFAGFAVTVEKRGQR